MVRVVTGGVVLLAFSLSARAQTPEPTMRAIGPPPAVVASGVSTVKRAPDRAFVTFATETRAPKPDDAQKRNAEAMADVQQVLRQANIPSDAIRTVSFDLREDVDWVDGKRTSRGYVVTNAVEARVDKLDDLGDLLDRTVSAGATNVSNIRFDLKDRAGAEREAMRLAVADARARADAAAAGAGVRVLKVVRIEDHTDRNVPGPPVPMMRMAAEARMAGPETPVAAGEIEIRANVTLTVSIEGR